MAKRKRNLTRKLPPSYCCFIGSDSNVVKVHRLYLPPLHTLLDRRSLLVTQRLLKKRADPVPVDERTLSRVGRTTLDHRSKGGGKNSTLGHRSKGGGKNSSRRKLLASWRTLSKRRILQDGQDFLLSEQQKHYPPCMKQAMTVVTTVL